MTEHVAETPLPRETGEEQAKPCPNCGGPRTLIKNADGSSSPAPCTTCFGEVARDEAVQQVDQAQVTGDTAEVLPLVSEQAAESPLPREQGVIPSEQE